jgi:hypothetical protein
MKPNYPVMINKYDYFVYSNNVNKDGQRVVAIYGVDPETLNNLYNEALIQLSDEANNIRPDMPSFIWNGEVYAMFEDFIIVYLY